MLTEEKVEKLIKKRRLWPTLEAFEALSKKAKRFQDDDQRKAWAERKYKEALGDTRRNIKKLVAVSNAYDFVFDNFILDKPASDQKRHFQVCEEILNDRSAELREALKISVNAE